MDDALVVLIDVLYCTDNLREAAEWIDIAERDRINPARTHYLKGLVLAKEGKLEPAVAEFEKSKELDPHLGQEAETQIAAMYALQGKFDRAADRLHSAIALDPTSDTGLFARVAKNYPDLPKEKSPGDFNVGIAYKYDTNVVTRVMAPLPIPYPSGRRCSEFQRPGKLHSPLFPQDASDFSAYYLFYADRYFGSIIPVR